MSLLCVHLSFLCVFYTIFVQIASVFLKIANKALIKENLSPLPRKQVPMKRRLCRKSSRPDSNRRPIDYESIALPTEPRKQIHSSKALSTLLIYYRKSFLSTSSFTPFPPFPYDKVYPDAGSAARPRRMCFGFSCVCQRPAIPALRADAYHAVKYVSTEESYGTNP